MISAKFVTYENYQNYQIEVRNHPEGFIWIIPSLLISGVVPSLSEAKTKAIDYIEENEI